MDEKEFVGKRESVGFDYYEVSSLQMELWNFICHNRGLGENSQVTIDPDKQSCDYFWNVRTLLYRSS